MKQTSHNTNPITSKEDVKKSKDERIDEDFKGFPNPPAKESIINPETKEDRKTAAVNGENNTQTKTDKTKINEEESDGSGGAFDAADPVPDTSYYQKKEEAKKNNDAY
ncbi:hypothetical protein [Foetidibacter luteolus]|uniref:hypothetical protein n=1 Tax=Foetidibacter luteolus TaxID=2608880 RepID=UPI00129A9075|nr:hypothetical protein [Foetidibacter luteolus]